MNVKKCLEYLTIHLVFTIFLFSPIISIITFICLSYYWSLKITFSLYCIYICWVYFDRHTDSEGGRWSDRCRRLSICKLFTNYFPLTLIKSHDLDAKRNYIFGFHPHGAFSFGALGNFCTDATHFSTLFPNIRSHLMLLHLQFLFPFTREILLYLGACCVSRESCEYLLNDHSRSHALVIIIGGAREMYLTKQDTMILYLNNRKGFIKLALKYGASLVPVISFGENQLYRRYSCFNLLSQGLIFGRFPFGHIPRRYPLVTIVGKPIDVQKTLDPTSTEIDQLHYKYIENLKELFETNKNQYDLEHINLEIV